MNTQINFKLSPANKSEFETACHTKNIEMARCLRALTLAVTTDQIPANWLSYFLELENQEYPETRGRKPGTTITVHKRSKTIKLRKKNRKKAA